MKSKKDRKDQFGGGNGKWQVEISCHLFRPSTPPAKSSPASSTKASPLKQRPIDPTFNPQQNTNTFAQALLVILILVITI